MPLKVIKVKKDDTAIINFIIANVINNADNKPSTSRESLIILSMVGILADRLEKNNHLVVNVLLKSTNFNINFLTHGERKRTKINGHP